MRLATYTCCRRPSILGRRRDDDRAPAPVAGNALGALGDVPARCRLPLVGTRRTDGRCRRRGGRGRGGRWRGRCRRRCGRRLGGTRGSGGDRRGWGCRFRRLLLQLATVATHGEHEPIGLEALGEVLPVDRQSQNHTDLALGVLERVHALVAQVAGVDEPVDLDHVHGVDPLDPLGLELGFRLALADGVVGRQDEPGLPLGVVPLELGGTVGVSLGNAVELLEILPVPLATIRLGLDGLDQRGPRCDLTEHRMAVALVPHVGVPGRALDLLRLALVGREDREGLLPPCLGLGLHLAGLGRSLGVGALQDDVGLGDDRGLEGDDVVGRRADDGLRAALAHLLGRGEPLVGLGEGHRRLLRCLLVGTEQDLVGGVDGLRLVDDHALVVGARDLDGLGGLGRAGGGGRRGRRRRALRLGIALVAGLLGVSRGDLLLVVLADRDVDGSEDADQHREDNKHSDEGADAPRPRGSAHGFLSGGATDSRRPPHHGGGQVVVFVDFALSLSLRCLE